MGGGEHSYTLGVTRNRVNGVRTLDIFAEHSCHENAGIRMKEREACPSVTETSLLSEPTSSYTVSTLVSDSQLSVWGVQTQGFSSPRRARVTCLYLYLSISASSQGRKLRT